MHTLADRFWAKVVKGNGCWIWSGRLNGRGPDHGYGLLRVGKRRLMAHRVAWSLTNGEPPHGMRVLHRCDVRDCVNPNHLFLGTDGDNVRDCRDKGRLNVAPAVAASRLARALVASFKP